MAYRVGVLGGSGYIGAELLRLVAGHPELEVVHVTAGANVGVPVGALYPSLASAYPGLTYEAPDPAALDGLDVVFAALPHGESQQLVPAIVGRVDHVVDLAADFRLSADDYATWYGEPHGAPDLLGSSRTACPSSSALTSQGAHTLLRPGATRPPRHSHLRRLSRRDSRNPPASWSTPSPVCRAAVAG